MAMRRKRHNLPPSPSHAAASKDRQHSRLWFGLPTQGYVAAHCFVCSRKLTSMLHRREGGIVQLADQERFYYGRDMPPYCFCGARCHGIFEPWMYQLEELEHEERYDYRSLHWTIGEATYNCKRQLRANRLFVGVGRAIGRLLLLRRWVAERSGQGGGGEGGEGASMNVAFAAAHIASRIIGTETTPQTMSDPQ